jgi:hypothetical protein
MYANDRLGDCTCCALAHMLEVWTKESDGRPRLLTDAEVIALYDLVNGGQDHGANMLDVLQQMRTGAGLAGDHLHAYAAVDHSRPDLVRSAAWLFQGLYIGIQMPLCAQDEVGPGKVWHPVDGPDGKPGSWGGHTVNVVGYDDSSLTVITWGAQQRMSWAFWQRYVEECWALLPADFQRRRRPLQANGFDFAQLDHYLTQLGPANPLTPTKA